MQYKFVILSLIGTAIADLATIQGALSPVSQAVTALDAGIQKIQGPQDAQMVIDLSGQVQQALSAATNTVSGTQPISVTDAITLQQTGAGLATQVMTTIQDLINKKPIIIAANRQQITLMSLQAQKTAANALSAAIVKQVPSPVQGIAQGTTGMIAMAIDMGIQAFS